MTASASDYAWFRTFQRGWLYEMYCLTLVKGLTPAEFLAHLDAEVIGDFAGLDAYAHQDIEFQEARDWNDDHMLVGAAPIQGPNGPWTLALEINGYVGIDHRFMERSSAGTRIVSHFRNVNALTSFHWWEDGRCRTSFESPYQRSGTTPDALLPAMAEAGYDLSDPQRKDAPGLDIPGMLALAEELTGIRVTADLLENATYTAGAVTIPDED